MTVYKVCVCHRSKEEVSVTLMEPVVVSAQLQPVAVSDSWMMLSNNDCGGTNVATGIFASDVPLLGLRETLN